MSPPNRTEGCLQLSEESSFHGPGVHSPLKSTPVILSYKNLQAQIEMEIRNLIHLLKSKRLAASSSMKTAEIGSFFSHYL